MVHIIEHDDDADVPWPNRQPAVAAGVGKDDGGKASKVEKKKTNDGVGESSGGGSSSGVSGGGGGSSSEAEAHKARGNECFAEGRWAEAEAHYTRALEACPAAALSDPTQTTTTTTSPSAGVIPSTSSSNSSDSGGGGGGGSSGGSGGSSGGSRNRPRAVYHANRAACYMGLERYAEAAEDCTDAIAADDAYTKVGGKLYSC